MVPGTPKIRHDFEIHPHSHLPLQGYTLEREGGAGKFHFPKFGISTQKYPGNQKIRHNI